MKQKQHNPYRKGRTKDGKPCRAAATAGGLCFFHANPNRASELGRIGGRRNRHAAAPNTDPLPNLNTVADVRKMVARLFSDVYAGRIKPRVATGLVPLLNLQVRAIEADVDQKLARLEKKLVHLLDEWDDDAVPEREYGDLPRVAAGVRSVRPLTPGHPALSDELPPNVDDCFDIPSKPPEPDSAPGRKYPDCHAIKAYASAAGSQD
jgi:hypothetical protein